MRRRIAKYMCLMAALSLLVAGTAFAALPNVYGKNYDKTVTGHICKMKAKGTSSLATTTATNTANGTRYYSVYVNRRNADTNAVLEKDVKESLVSKDSSKQVSVSRSKTAADKEFVHRVKSWNCSMVPQGNGLSAFLDDELSYVVKQRK